MVISDRFRKRIFKWLIDEFPITGDEVMHKESGAVFAKMSSLNTSIEYQNLALIHLVAMIENIFGYCDYGVYEDIIIDYFYLGILSEND